MRRPHSHSHSQSHAHRPFHRRHYVWLRHIPRRKHLRGGWLHRLLGDRLFAPELWRFTRPGVARGLALGLFIGFTPTMGAQIVLGGVAAYLARVNIPVALAATLVTNPFTAAVVYTLEFQLGVWLVGMPEAGEMNGYSGLWMNFARYAKPIWAGALVTGGLAAVLGYALVNLLWVESRQVQAARQQRIEDKTRRESRRGTAGPG